jgi:hypothetical protein
MEIDSLSCSLDYKIRNKIETKQAALDSTKENYFHGVLEYGNMIALLYTFPRGLLSKRWQPELSKLC